MLSGLPKRFGTEANLLPDMYTRARSYIFSMVLIYVDDLEIESTHEIKLNVDRDENSLNPQKRNSPLKYDERFRLIFRREPTLEPPSKALQIESC